ncbi:MAG: hypothetical protein KDA83_19745 [Planctomycetales bacterium]|nr:hypothetical protein [Planctomycetales bacterium]
MPYPRFSLRRCRVLACSVLIVAVSLSCRDSAQGLSASTVAVTALLPQQLPEIRDEPIRIDPSAGLPPSLTENVSVDFGEATLEDFVDWLEHERGLTVLVDRDNINLEGWDLDSRYSDRITDQPTYLLLNRLKHRELGWSISDGILTITSRSILDEQISTRSYRVGDLRDMGYDLEAMVETLTQVVAPDTWEELGGSGRIVALGDVIMVLQTDENHRQIEMLLEALRTPARRILVGEPAVNQAIHEALAANVDCDFRSLPLRKVVERLRETTGVDIRINELQVGDYVKDDAFPVSLNLRNRKLGVVLDSLLVGLPFDWLVDDGVIWITEVGASEGLLKVAVYDVADLCRDQDETNALMQAIEGQASPDSWEELGGAGRINQARIGVLAIYQTQDIHDQVLGLLEAYRFALRNSKPRAAAGPDLDVMATVYYRTYAPIAEQLVEQLPTLVATGTWERDGVAEGGTVTLIPSLPESQNVAGLGSDVAGTAAPRELAQAVLIVRQKRAVHREIRELLRRIESGDIRGGTDFGEPPIPSHPHYPGAIEGMGGGMGGMGGFGGGFLQLPSSNGDEG